MSSIYCLPSNLIHQNRAIGSIIIGEPGSGKHSPISEKIYTPEGVVRCGDINIGDTIYGKNGQPVTVLGVYPQGKRTIWEVTLADGRKLKCGREHLFTFGRLSHGKIKWDTKTTEEILNLGYLTNRKGIVRAKFFLPNNDAIQYPHREYDIHPYIIGAFLGNGCKNNQDDALRISSGDDFVPNKIAKLLTEKLGSDITAKKYEKTYTYVFHFKETGKRVHAKHLTNDCEIISLLTHCYSYDKYIPDKYKYGSINQRYELVRGLMDTDGTIGLSPRFNMSYNSGSKKLIEDIKEVVRGLGNIYVSDEKIDNRRDNPNYSIFIGCDNIRKKDFFTKTSKLNLYKLIIEVKDYLLIHIYCIKGQKK